MLKSIIQVKHLRIKHYLYTLLSLCLIVYVVHGLVTSLRTVRAEATSVTITSPTPNQQLFQGAQSITGTGPALKNISILDGTQRIGATTILANGTWSLAWNNQIPGHHSLKAMVASGTLYTANSASQSSIAAHDLNSGQLSQSYSAGLSGTGFVTYDNASHRILAVNYSSSTVSFIDSNTNNVVSTVVFDPNPTGVNVTVRGSFYLDSTFDQTHQRLYILENNIAAHVSKVYILDTHSGALITSVTINNNATGTKLQADPSGKYLYIYKGAGLASEDSRATYLMRIDLQTNTLDSSWTSRFSNVSDIVTTLSGDVYMLQNNGGLTLQVYDKASDSIESVNIDSSVCDGNLATNPAPGSHLAISADYHTVYYSCNLGSDSKIVAYDTSTASVVTTFTHDSFITSGQLTGTHLLLSSDSGNSIRVINTSTNTEEPIVHNYTLGDYVTPHFLGYGSNNELYFATGDSSTNSIYTADLTNGQITQHHDYSVPETFSGITNAATVPGDTERVAILPHNSNETIQLISPQTGTYSRISYGMGSAGRVFAVPDQHRLFSLFQLPLSNFNVSTNPAEYQGVASQINVADSSDGSYETSIQIPPGYATTSAQLSPDKTTLYVLALPLDGTSNTRVIAVNTATLTISRIYNSLPHLDYTDTSHSQYGSYDIYAPQLAVSQHDLFFANNTALYHLDLDGDTAQSTPYTSCDTGDSGASSCWIDSSVPGIAIDNSGDHVALLAYTNIDKSVANRATIAVYNAHNLAKEKDIPTQYSASQLLLNLAFDSSNNVLLSSIALAVRPVIQKYNFATGASLGSTALGQSVTVPSDSQCISKILPTQQPSFWLARISCFGNNSTSVQEVTSLVDTDNMAEDYSVELNGTASVASYNFLALNNTSADANVSSATQDVTIIGAHVGVITPTQGATIDPGTQTIVGAALPNTSVVVKIDDAVVGSATADAFGKWQYDYNFTTAGSHKIRAEQQQSNQNVIYLSKNISIIGGGGAVGGTIYTFNTNTHDLVSSLNLPNGDVIGMMRVSSDKTKLYVLGENNQTANFYTIDINTHTISHTTPLTSLPGSFFATGLGSGSAGDFLLSQFIMSADERKLYVITATNVISNGSTTTHEAFKEIDAQTGQELKSIAIPSSYLVMFNFQQSVITHQGKRILMTAFSPAQNTSVSSSVITVNLEDNTASAVDLVDQNTILAGLSYDALSNTLYTLFGTVDHNSNNPYPQLSVVAFDADTQTTRYTTTFTHTNGGLTTPLLSTDGAHLYVAGISDSGQPQIVDMTTQDGSYAVHTADSPTYLSSMGPMFSAFSYLYSWGLSANSDFSQFYWSHMYLHGTNAPVYDVATDIFDTNQNKVVGDQADTPEFVKDGQALTAYGNNFSAPLNGALLSDEHTVEVVTSSVPPITQPPTPPSGQGIIPPIKLIPPGTVSGTKPTTNTGSTSVSPPKLQPQSPSARLAFQLAEHKLTYRSPFNKLRTNFRKVLLKVPRPIINSVPYFLFLVLLMQASYYLFQTQKQLRFERRLRNLFDKRTVLSEEKRNFLELTSHYLRTPLTYIKAGAEMITKASPSDPVVAELSQSVGHLGLFVESLVEEAGSDKRLDDIDPPEKIRSAWLNKTFLLPLIGFFSALGLFYLCFIWIADIRFSTAVYITQVLISFLLVQLFYGMYKNHQRVMSEKAYLQQTIQAETALDHARSKLLLDAGEQLQTRTQHLSSIVSNVNAQTTSQKIIQQGIERLQELAQAFNLVSRLEAKAIDGKLEPVSVRDLAAEVIKPFTTQLEDKKLKLSVVGFGKEVVLTTNKPFAELTLKSLVENAIEASREGSSLTVKCLHNSGRVAFQVIDHGVGIPKDKLGQLFKPFVRVGPVTTFNREGIGLSLFIDRLVMHALGGEVEIQSAFERGTVATLTFSEATVAVED